MAPYTHFSIAETLEKFIRKEISPGEVTEAHLDRIRVIQPKLNPFVHVDEESARARARESEERFRRGTARALEGIPVTVKSCIDVAGWPCPAGSLLRKDYVPHTNAPLVSRLEDAGAILLGNTNTPEFLMAYETNNLLNGKTSNPWNAEYSAGGSSGGEAAAIGSGCSMGGVGSDGGGSIRTPAHFSGICGLKPTPGRVPATGHFPSGAGAFSWIGVVGPMARSCADLGALLRVMGGPDAGDAMSAPVPFQSVSCEGLKGIRIGILESVAIGKATNETQACVAKAGQLLAERGLHVEPVTLPRLEQALELWWYFFGAVIGGLLKQSTSGKEALVSPMLKEYLRAALAEPAPTLESFMKACAVRDLLRAEILRQINDVQLLISPVSNEPAFRHGEGNYVRGKPHCYGDTMRPCQWLNLVGFPGLSVPIGKSPENLPINVQLIGKPHEEDLLLAVGELLEESRGAWQLPVD